MEERISKIETKNLLRFDSLPDQIEYTYSKLIKSAAFIVFPLLYFGFLVFGVLDLFILTLPIVICLFIVVVVIVKVAYDENKRSGFVLTKKGVLTKDCELGWSDIISIEHVAKHSKGGRSTYFYLRLNLESNYVEISISNLNHSESDIIRMTMSFYERVKQQ